MRTLSSAGPRRYSVLVAELSSMGMIDAARIFYNDAVREYNTAIRSFPNVLFAGAFGFNGAVYCSQGM